VEPLSCGSPETIRWSAAAGIRCRTGPGLRAGTDLRGGPTPVDVDRDASPARRRSGDVGLLTRAITAGGLPIFVKACAEDGEKPAENSNCEGYYIRNNSKKLRTLTVYPDAPIRTAQGGMKPVDLETFLRQVDNGNVIRFDIDANRIMKLEHVYLP
jgi:hypothetical protein